MRVIASLLFVGILSAMSSPCEAQMSRVNGYVVTPFESTWDSLRIETAATAQYLGGTNDGKYSIQLPFDFPFDGGVVPQGTMIGVGANGAISLVDGAIPPLQIVGNADHPMLIAPFNGDIKQGSDKKSGAADTLGLYQVIGTAPNRVLTIEYPAFHLRGGGSGTGSVDTLAAMQVKLYETSGVIEFLYREHGLELPSRFPIPPKASIGLNGGVLPEFRSKVIASDTRTIPATNLRWTPGTASVDLASESDLQIYPNPALSWMRVILKDGETAMNITATDKVGRTITLHANEGGRIDVSTLAAGTYLIKIETKSRTYAKNVTVMR